MEIWKNLHGRYNIRKTHIELLEMKTTMYEMKNTTNRDNRLGTAEEKICKLENIPTIKNETQKKIKSKKPASVSCGTISSSQVYMSLQDPPHSPRSKAERTEKILEKKKKRKNI